MRTSVLGVVNFNDITQVVKQSVDIAIVTHADPRCVASCVALTSYIALHLQGHNFQDAFQLASEIGRKTLRIYTETIEKKWIRSAGCKFFKKFLMEKNGNFQEEGFDKWIFGEIDEFQPFDGENQGFTYLCLAAAFWAARQDDWSFAVREICWRGGDADTNAAVAGAILGCKLGFQMIPQSLVRELKHFEWLWGISEEIIEVVSLGFKNEGNFMDDV
jgi:ADP-ribosylglycohydrolase